MDRDPRDAADRIEESVRHALRLVGPGERALEAVGDDDRPDRPAAA